MISNFVWRGNIFLVNSFWWNCASGYMCIFSENKLKNISINHSSYPAETNVYICYASAYQCRELLNSFVNFCHWKNLLFFGRLCTSQGMNLCPLPQEHRVLTTGLPGDSWKNIFLSSLNIYLFIFKTYVDVSGLNCSMRDLPRSFTGACGLLVAVHRLLSSCGAQAPERAGSVVVMWA